VRVEKIGNATLYLGDCMEILPTLPKVDAVITDPPYGLGDKLHGTSNKKAEWGKLYDAKGGFEWDQTTHPLVTELPKFAPYCVVWGGNYYDMPPARGWLVWDKVVRQFSSGHCELAWTNLDQPIRAFNFTNGELATEGKEHPTQKPLALMRWCIEQAGRPGLTLDPFMGSGTTGVAAVGMGLSFIGIEREMKYFDIACRRIEDAQRQAPLIAHEPAAKAEQAELL
jgi:site-specific DNA-methyltransferase (adenine-specific)